MSTDNRFVFPDVLIERIRTAVKIAVMTGAGTSAESGIPTFREAQTGLWSRYRPEDLATPQAFARNPGLVWQWYTWRRELICSANPNPGHFALARMEKLIPKLMLITQNVDGLHQQAGSGQITPIIELHGNIHRTKCFEHGHPEGQWEVRGQELPTCPICDSLLRPDVVWFGESLPSDALAAAWNAARTAEIFFSIGTSALVEPAASLPHITRQAGGRVVEINPNETPLTPYADFILRGFAGEILPELVKAAWN